MRFPNLGTGNMFATFIPVYLGLYCLAIGLAEANNLPGE